MINKNSLLGQFIFLTNERLEKVKTDEEKNILKEVLKLGVKELENVFKIY